MKRILTFVLIAGAALLWNGCYSGDEAHECCDGHSAALETRSQAIQEKGSDALFPKIVPLDPIYPRMLEIRCDDTWHKGSDQYGQFNTVAVKASPLGETLHFNIFSVLTWNINIAYPIGDYSIRFKEGNESGPANVWPMPSIVPAGAYSMFVYMGPNTLSHSITIGVYMSIDLKPEIFPYAGLRLLITQPPIDTPFPPITNPVQP